MGSSVKVLSSRLSPFGVRVLIALKAKGVAYEFIEEPDVMQIKSKLLLESNPVHKKVPVLFHNGKPICESLIIVQYIDDTWPSQDGHGFLPHDPYQRALVRFWADYIDKKVFEGCMLAIRNVQEDLVEQGRSILKESMVTLEGALRDVFGAGRYFGGEHINLVDIILVTYFSMFELLEMFGNFKFLDESTCPCLCAWAKVVVEYPAVKEGRATAPPEKLLEAFRAMRKTWFGLAE